MSINEELRRYWLRPSLLASIILMADQLTKAEIWAALGPVEGTSTPVFDPWLKFTLVRNTGVAFGMFQGTTHIFTVTSIIISIAAAYYYRKHMANSRLWVQACLGLIIGGAIGNIIDRIRFGFVIDFIHVRWFPGIFNIADAAITCGVALLAIYLMFTGETEPQSGGDDRFLGELLTSEPPERRAP